MTENNQSNSINLDSVQFIDNHDEFITIPLDDSTPNPINTNSGVTPTSEIFEHNTICLENYGSGTFKEINCVSLCNPSLSNEIKITSKVCCDYGLNVYGLSEINGKIIVNGDLHLHGNLHTTNSKDICINDNNCLMFGSNWRMKIEDEKMVIQKLNVETNNWDTKTTIN